MSKKKDIHILYYFLAAFGVVFAVNGFFVYKATQTHTGIVTDNAYEKGLAYNQTIELAEMQEELNLQSEILLEGKELTFKLDQQAEVTAYISRPTQSGMDFEVKLAENNGVYSAFPNFPVKGQWLVTIVAKWDGQQYQTSKTVVVN